MIKELFRMLNNVLTDANEHNDGRRACAIPTRCRTPRRRTFEEIMLGNWEEFVIRYDRASGSFTTRTACCVGSPVCC